MPRPALPTMLAVLVTALALAATSAPAAAVSPYGGPRTGGTDPYAYQDYLRVSAEQYPPSEFGPDGDDGNAWKYGSTSACELYGQDDLEKCTPRTRLNEQDPQELFNVTGASVDKS